jgi:hypothetical protein
MKFLGRFNSEILIRHNKNRPILDGRFYLPAINEQRITSKHHTLDGKLLLNWGL